MSFTHGGVVIIKPLGQIGRVIGIINNGPMTYYRVKCGGTVYCYSGNQLYRAVNVNRLIAL